MRAVRAQRTTLAARAQIVVEHGSFADGVDTGLRNPRIAVDRRTVAHGEEVLVPDDLQGGLDAHETGGVEGERRVLEQRHRRGSCRPYGEVAGDAIVREHDRVLLDGHDFGSGADLDAPSLGFAADHRGNPRRVAGHHLLAFTQYGDLRIDARREQPCAQGKGELHTGCARAHHRDEGRALRAGVP